MLPVYGNRVVGYFDLHKSDSRVNLRHEMSALWWRDQRRCATRDREVRSQSRGIQAQRVEGWQAEEKETSTGRECAGTQRCECMRLSRQSDLCRDEQSDNLGKLPNVVGQASRHRWSNPQRLVDACEIVVDEMDRAREPVIFQLLGKAIGQSGKSGQHSDAIFCGQAIHLRLIMRAIRLHLGVIWAIVGVVEKLLALGVCLRENSLAGDTHKARHSGFGLLNFCDAFASFEVPHCVFRFHSHILTRLSGYARKK